MRNYVIINGVNSLTIQGLAINNLPPITKPMIRTQREEIDGRDGDIVTELGYSAYDKQIEIGLWGTYDINDIIKYFTGEGTIVFSNEEDKYYNFKILDQIDYQKLLKFKTATVTFHCQPFKYPLEEEPVEAELTTLTGTGTTITLNNTEEAPMSLVYKGNTLQSGTPTPDNPIPIQVVSGDNEVVVTGKNLLYNQKLPMTQASVNMTYNNGIFGVNGTALISSNAYIIDYNTPLTHLEAGESLTYYIERVSGISKVAFLTYFIPDDGSATDYTWGVTLAENTNSNKVVKTATKSGKVDHVQFFLTNGEVYNSEVKILVQKGNIANPTYEPYTGESYPISLGDKELLKIGTYQDKIDKSSGKNLFNKDSQDILENVRIGADGGNNADSGYFISEFIEVTPNTKYTKNTTADAYHRFAFYTDKSTNSFISKSEDNTITTPSNAKYLRLCGLITEKGSIMLNEGTTALPYEPYGTSWYLKKEIGKVVLDGSEEGWAYSSNNTNFNIRAYYLGMKSTSMSKGYIPKVCSHFKYFASDGNHPNLADGIYENINDNTISFLLFHCNSLNITTLQDWYNWLSANKPIIYYVLETPTYTLIEDSTLIEELESMKKSYENQTNISQTNNDLPFELDVSVTFLTPMEINNIGNIYAKPILTIEGTGNIGVVLNDIQILDIDLTNNGKIAIDVPKLEAYNPDDDTLLNRLVTGDYMKLLINEGENTITFTGNVSGATLTNYIRWI